MHPISDEIEEELRLVAREVEHLSIVLQRIAGRGPLEHSSQEKWEVTWFSLTWP